MVDGGHDRQVRRDSKQAGAEALVVVHHIELSTAFGEQSCRPQAEGAGFAETTGPHGAQLEQVDAVADLADVRNSERIGFAVQIEARNFGEPDTWIKDLGVGLTREHLDLVAEFDQAPTQVADINALATAVCLAAVGQQRDPHAHTPPRAENGAPGELDMCPPYISTN